MYRYYTQENRSKLVVGSGMSDTAYGCGWVAMVKGAADIPNQLLDRRVFCRHLFYMLGLEPGLGALQGVLSYLPPFPI